MLDWKDLRVLNTRPFGQHHALSQTIRDAGGIPIECPALAIEPIENDWAGVLGDLSRIQQAIFISPNAVHYCLRRLKAAHLPWPPSIYTIAIGQTTHDALIEWGLRVDDVPSGSTSEDLLQLSSMQHVNHQIILIIKGENGRTLLADTLTQRGATVETLDVYRRTLPAVDSKMIQSLWQTDAVDAIVFTSETAMQNLLHLFGAEACAWLKSKTCFVTSQRLLDAAVGLGFQHIKRVTLF
jgi:uroporphyrinogen-III synthase